MSLTAQSDAQRAVIDELSRPAGRVLSQRSSPGGWIAELRKAGGADADASTVQFVKERRIGAKEHFGEAPALIVACCEGLARSPASVFPLCRMPSWRRAPSDWARL